MKKNLKKDIDFVILWVNCNDLEWQKKRKKYNVSEESDNSIIRYQDWENLKYWFRSVEKNAPWVRTIHLVTDGQIPDWLDVSCQKINLVKHLDYMPKDALPTFNSSAIEIGIHRIKDLSDRFVYFNDDMFLTSEVTEEYYFKNGIPVDMPGYIRTPKKIKGNIFSALLENNNKIIYKNFTKKEVIWNNFFKWFKPLYGKNFFRSICYIFKESTPGFVIPHLSTPYLKFDFEKVWKKEETILKMTQYNRFRSVTDVTHFLFRNWRMAEGKFISRRSKGKYFGISNEVTAKTVAKSILKKQYPEICINESCSGEEFEKVKQIINEALKMTYPEKSIFEK